jgi:hypothetical protein
MTHMRHLMLLVEAWSHPVPPAGPLFFIRNTAAPIRDLERGEDVFNNGEFVGMINWDATWDDLMSLED